MKYSKHKTKHKTKRKTKRGTYAKLAVRVSTDVGHLLISEVNGGYFEIAQNCEFAPESDYADNKGPFKDVMFIGDREALMDMGNAILKLAKLKGAKGRKTKR